MNLNPSDEQRPLRESAERFVAESYDADHRRKTAKDPLGFSPAVWKQSALPEDMLTVVPEYLNGRAYTIFGGTSEIQRDIIAKMMLGISASRP